MIWLKVAANFSVLIRRQLSVVQEDKLEDENCL